MLLHFATALLFCLVAAGFLFGALLAGRFVRPRRPHPVKAQSYECGEEPVGPAWVNFNIRFALIALVFVIFDVEAALMFPVGAVVRSWAGRGRGFVALVELAIFVAILFAGLVYLWAKGDLEWVKTLETRDPRLETRD